MICKFEVLEYCTVPTQENSLFGDFLTNLVTSLHISPFENTSSQLKYKLKGLTISTAHAAVVKNAPVRYIREITGISMYLCVAKTI